jgi:molecular chaperone GrpE (heat shock protein)
MSSDNLFVGVDQIVAALDVSARLAEQEERHRRETAALLRRLLGVLDSLQAVERQCRELAAAGVTQAPHKAVNVTFRQMLQELSTVGLEPMNVVGRPLDLAQHEVVGVRHDPSVAEDTVLEETVPGYVWKHGLLRQAKVVISRASDSAAPSSLQRGKP